MSAEALLQTPLTGAHRRAGARMVDFAGYDMPVQYAPGVLKEHLWTRAHAGLFDVSHMGPGFVTLETRSGDPAADHAAISALIEPLICGDVAGLAPGQLRYTLLLNEDGGIIDDLMIGRPLWENRQGMLYLVVNAARKAVDFPLIATAIDGRARLDRADDRALIAIQGPEAAAVLGGIVPEAAGLGFMRHARFDLEGTGLLVSRSGYTGEDGFEILALPEMAVKLWDRLAADPRVEPVGLGARDSLRLEAGLPLWGHDIDETTSPVEAALDFALSKKRLKAGAIRGSARIARERAEGPARVRVGLRVLQGAPAREGAAIADAQGHEIGVVTSGGFSPSLGAPIAMGYVPPAFAAPGTALQVIVRGRPQTAEVASLPFTPHRYHRAAA
ncbi:MAG: glycine cleavage system aminomethyltransferase GcvT [Caulobacteraceae bacterium]|nr:glycine cleavage system aminomethyltransferase GcvT [Caulobacteraceae bacterium]